MPKQTISLSKLNNLNNWYYDNNNITITKIPVLNEIESLKNKDIITKITITIIVPTQVDVWKLGLACFCASQNPLLNKLV